MLRDGIADGIILWLKSEQYQNEPSGDLPQRFETEIWLGANPDGTITTAVSTLHLPDGPETMDMTASYGRQVLTLWLNQAWDTAELAQQAGAEFQGRGTLHGWESLIYEWKSDTEVQRLEVVEDAPIIVRESVWKNDREGGLTLIQSNTVLEYRLLPAGTAPPETDR